MVVGFNWVAGLEGDDESPDQGGCYYRALFSLLNGKVS
jgi:hypothetical protein